MSMVYTDVDILVHQVRDRTSRKLIEEAIIAYRGGAFRSAILSTYVAVAHDLISKIRELARDKHSQAKKLSEEVDKTRDQVINAIKKDNQTSKSENDLLKDAIEILDLGSYQKEAFKRLKKDRNDCAHLNYKSDFEIFNPSPELTRTHIVHALQYMLINGPLRGPRLIEALLDDQILDEPSLREFENFKSYLDVNYLNRTNDTTISNLIEQVFKYAFEEDMYLSKISTLARVIEVISRSKTNVYESYSRSIVSNVCKGLSDDRLLFICLFIEKDFQIWEWIDDLERDRISDIISQHSDPLYLIKSSAINLSTKFEKIEGAIIERFKKMADPGPDLFNPKCPSIDEIKVLSEIKNPSKKIIETAISQFSTSPCYAYSNDMGPNLISPLSRHFKSSDVELLLDHVLDNYQILDSFENKSVLNTVFEETKNYFEETKEFWENFLEKLGPKYSSKHYELKEKVKELSSLNLKNRTDNGKSSS